MATANRQSTFPSSPTSLLLIYEARKPLAHGRGAQKVKIEFGREIPDVAQRRKVTTDKRTSTNPRGRRRSLAFFKNATKEMARQASKTPTVL